MDMFSAPPEIPLGLGMALAKNPPALESYAKLSREQKRSIIERTQSIDSPAEMEAFVRSLSAD